MAQTVTLKRSAVPNKEPQTTDLSLGELAINTYDGRVFFKKDPGTPVVIELAVVGQNAIPFFKADGSPSNVPLV